VEDRLRGPSRNDRKNVIAAERRVGSAQGRAVEAAPLVPTLERIHSGIRDLGTTLSKRPVRPLGPLLLGEEVVREADWSGSVVNRSL
jgi:hypothetical protein